MKTVPFGIAGLALLASGLFGFSTPLRAQQGGEPQPIVSRALAATVDYGNEVIFQPAKQGTNFERLGLGPEQVINVTVQFPLEMVGQTILAGALDGGLVAVPENGLVVADDGTVVFQYQASSIIGGCRVAVHQPDDMSVLQFWVVDFECPDNNPPDLPGGY